MYRHNDSYSRYCDASAELGERRDCVVVALGLVLEIPYREAHRACAELLGRENRRGVYFDIGGARTVAQHFGRDFVYVIPPLSTTMITIAQRVPKGRYIIGVRRHVAALVNGSVLDHSQGSRRRVDRVFRLQEHG